MPPEEPRTETEERLDLHSSSLGNLLKLVKDFEQRASRLEDNEQNAGRIFRSLQALNNINKLEHAKMNARIEALEREVAQ